MPPDFHLAIWDSLNVLNLTRGAKCNYSPYLSWRVLTESDYCWKSKWGISIAFDTSGVAMLASAWTVNPLQEKMLAASVQSIVTLCGGRRGWNQSDCALQSLASGRWLAWWTRKSWSWLWAQGGTFLAHQDTLSIFEQDSKILKARLLEIVNYWRQDRLVFFNGKDTSRFSLSHFQSIFEVPLLVSRPQCWIPDSLSRRCYIQYNTIQYNII